NPTATTNGIVFTGLEPIDLDRMAVTINNIPQPPAPPNTCDITITYGSQAETYRKVTFNSADARFIEKQINKISQLVTVAPAPGGYATSLTPINALALTDPAAPGAGVTTFNAADFGPAFLEDSSLDKVDIFNLMAVPGVADNSIWSEAAA